MIIFDDIVKLCPLLLTINSGWPHLQTIRKLQSISGMVFRILTHLPMPKSLFRPLLYKNLNKYLPLNIVANMPEISGFIKQPMCIVFRLKLAIF